MSEKKTRMNRRAMIAAAGALPLIAVSVKAQGAREGTKIVVDLGGLKLSDEVASKLEKAIRKDVLNAIAASALKQRPIETRLPPGTLGYVVRWPDIKQLPF